MIHAIQICVALIALVAVVQALSRRWSLPAPVLLLPAGLVLSFVPGVPRIGINPQIILLFFLPPLVFVGAEGMAWRDFRDNLRPISLLAVGCVLATTIAVASVAHWLIGMPWAVAFVLGAVVSPPDVVAAVAIAGKLSVPRRISTILQGEGLVNDATALILLGFAEAAVTHGTFSPLQATTKFAMVVFGETFWGLGIGWVAVRLQRCASDALVEMTIGFLVAFAAYWPVEYVGGSGVLATVAAGLYLGAKAPGTVSSNTRLAGGYVSHFLAFVLEGLLFLLTGMQFGIIEKHLAGVSFAQQTIYAAAVCAAVIIIRFIWVYPATYLPRWLIPSLRRSDPAPNWTYPFIIAFAGMRGGISLAAALAIPLVTESAMPFPHRDMVLFLTFCVILVTLVGQGLTLPFWIRRFRLHEAGKNETIAERDEELTARRLGVEAALKRLDELSTEKDVPESVSTALRRRHEARHGYLDRSAEEGGRKDVELGQKIQRELINAERQRIFALQEEGKITDRIRRRIERELDLEDVRLRRGEE